MDFNKIATSCLPDLKTIEDFEKLAPVGTTIWHITSCGGEPHSVIHFTIAGYERNDIGMQIHTKDDDERRSCRYVGDLTNCYHGAFLTKEKAEEYLGHKKALYEVERGCITHELERLADELLDRAFDEFFDHHLDDDCNDCND